MRVYGALARWEESRITFEELVRMAEAFLWDYEGAEANDAEVQRLRSLATELELPGLHASKQEPGRDQLIVLQALLLQEQQERRAGQADALEEVERMLRETSSDDDSK